MRSLKLFTLEIFDWNFMVYEKFFSCEVQSRLINVFSLHNARVRLGIKIHCWNWNTARAEQSSPMWLTILAYLVVNEDVINFGFFSSPLKFHAFTIHPLTLLIFLFSRFFGFLFVSRRLSVALPHSLTITLW